MIAALFSFFIFAFIAGFHLYWAFGGKRGAGVVVPQQADGTPLFSPKAGGTAVMGLVFLGVGLFHLMVVGLISLSAPGWLMHYGPFVLAAGLTLRALGDFRYMGFFKRIKETPFARWDTRYFSPLCLVLAASAVAMGLSVAGS